MNSSKGLVEILALITEFNESQSDQFRIVDVQVHNVVKPVLLCRITNAKFTDKTLLLPFWNFMVKQGEHDPDELFMATIAGDFFFDHLIFPKNGKSSIRLNAIVRHGCFLICSDAIEVVPVSLYENSSAWKVLKQGKDDNEKNGKRHH